MRNNNLGSAAKFDIGSGFASLASGLATLGAASAQASQLKIQRMFDNINLAQEKLRAREQSVFLRQKFLQTISSANASFAARGISTGSGAAARFAGRAGEVLGEDLQAVRFGSEARQTSMKLQISQNKLAESTAKNLGLLGSIGSFSKGTQSLLTGFKQIKNADSTSKDS